MHCSEDRCTSFSSQNLVFCNSHIKDCSIRIRIIMSKREEQDSIPVRVIQKIVDHMCVRDKFRAMRVSKQWESAARLSIQQQKRLVLRVTGDCFDDHIPLSDDPDVIQETFCQAIFSGIPMSGLRKKNHQNGSVWKSLMQMKQLQVLIVDRGKHDYILTVSPIIRQNCLTLQHLQLSCFCHLRDVFFPKLRSLVCDDLYDGNIESAPMLQSLTCGEVSRSVLSRLPRRLTRLTASCSRYPGPDVTKILVIQRFEHLKHLSLALSFLLLPADLFSCFQHLVSIRVHVIVNKREAAQLPLMDDVIVNLIRSNERLQEMDFQNVNVSDESLQTLSQIPFLRFVSFTHSLTSCVTTEGVMSLLRGRSRQTLGQVFLMTSEDLDADMVSQEVRLMHQQTNQAVKVVLTTPACHRMQRIGISASVSVRC